LGNVEIIEYFPILHDVTESPESITFDVLFEESVFVIVVGEKYDC